MNRIFSYTETNAQTLINQSVAYTDVHYIGYALATPKYTEFSDQKIACAIVNARKYNANYNNNSCKHNTTTKRKV